MELQQTNLTVSEEAARQAELKRLKLVVIDDDPSFLNIISSAADYEGIEYETFGSLDEMGTFTRLGNYDLAVLDYSLPSMTGIEIAEYIDIFFEGMPVILVSSTDCALINEDSWPDCIREFLPKGGGIGSIIGSVKSILDDGERPA